MSAQSAPQTPVNVEALERDLNFAKMQRTRVKEDILVLESRGELAPQYMLRHLGHLDNEIDDLKAQLRNV